MSHISSLLSTPNPSPQISQTQDLVEEIFLPLTVLPQPRPPHVRTYKTSGLGKEKLL